MSVVIASVTMMGFGPQAPMREPCQEQSRGRLYLWAWAAFLELGSAWSPGSACECLMTLLWRKGGGRYRVQTSGQQRG